MGLRSGKAIRFHESTARAVGRTAMGVKGVTLGGPNDEVIGMVCINDTSSDILVVSENGYGKRSAVDDYRITNRGGKGVKTLQVTEKTGELISILNVTDENDLMIINKSGITIRMAVEELRVMGRATQGVRLISLRGKTRLQPSARCQNPTTTKGRCQKRELSTTMGPRLQNQTKRMTRLQQRNDRRAPTWHEVWPCQS